MSALFSTRAAAAALISTAAVGLTANEDSALGRAVVVDALKLNMRKQFTDLSGSLAAVDSLDKYNKALVDLTDDLLGKFDPKIVEEVRMRMKINEAEAEVVGDTADTASAIVYLKDVPSGSLPSWQTSKSQPRVKPSGSVAESWIDEASFYSEPRWAAMNAAGAGAQEKASELAAAAPPVGRQISEWSQASEIADESKRLKVQEIAKFVRPALDRALGRTVSPEPTGVTADAARDDRHLSATADAARDDRHLSAIRQGVKLRPTVKSSCSVAAETEKKSDEGMDALMKQIRSGAIELKAVTKAKPAQKAGSSDFHATLAKRRAYMSDSDDEDN